MGCAPWSVLPLALLLAGPAFAGAADDARAKFGSDDANLETFWDLIERGVRFEASAGVWWAELDGGLTRLIAAMDETGSNKAVGTIGGGSGLVREVRLAIDVLGNEAYFNYLSDQLFERLEGEVRENVDSRLAQELILQVAGELRPKLESLLGPDATGVLRVDYGRFEGAIGEPGLFASRNGDPYFGGRSASWATEYFSLEAGVRYRFDDDAGEPLNSRRRRKAFTGGDGAGLFARYTNFTRPLALGFGNIDTGDEYVLQDGEIQLLGLGFRADVASCDTWCWHVSGYMIPFTGVVALDLGPWGTTYGAPFGGGFDFRLSLPIYLVGDLGVAPYAAFRAEWFMPILGSEYDYDIYKIQVWTPDYLLWGPSVGLMVKI